MLASACPGVWGGLLALDAACPPIGRWEKEGKKRGTMFVSSSPQWLRW